MTSTRPLTHPTHLRTKPLGKTLEGPGATTLGRRPRLESLIVLVLVLETGEPGFGMGPQTEYEYDDEYEAPHPTLEGPGAATLGR